MAIIKIKFARHLQKLVNYVMQGKEPMDPICTHNCDEASIVSDFEAIRSFENGNGAINVIHIVQSWNESESKKLQPSEFNNMGRELILRKFPGHAFAVVTHTDTKNIHNHIVVSPWNSETGKKVENKKYHLYELRSISDDLCRERGLSIINGPAIDRQARLPDKVQKIAKFRGGSWLLDLCQKADFARAYATSFDQYVGILGELGVKARVEEKNLSYFYSEKARGKRGSKLGREYDKEGLQQAFKANDEKFARIPGLREQVHGLVSAAGKGQTDQRTAQTALEQLPDSTYRSLVRDYGAYSKMPRPGRGARFPHQLDVASSIIPIEEMRRARNSNIIQYCQANKIALERSSDGKMVLKGRSFVEIGEYEWVNTRNRTKGSLIELVAAHKDLTFLQAVSEITGNKRLHLLEQHFGETKRNYTSFYIPKEQRLNELDAKLKIGSVLAHHGCDPSHAATLFKSGQAQVSKEGVVRFFGKDDDGGGLEFVESESKTWHKSKVGTVTKAFFSVSTGGKKVTVYLDPFVFLNAHGKQALWPAKHQQDLICLVEPDERVLDQYLAAHRRVEQMEVFLDPKSANHQVELDFFNNLKIRYPQLGIHVGESRGLTRERSRGYDLPSF